MPRAVVYDSPLVQALYADEIAKQEKPPQRRVARSKAVSAAKGDNTPAGGAGAMANLHPADGYLTKIAKYVPAETITVATLMFAAFKPDGNTVWVFVAVGAVVNAIYLFSLSVGPADATTPRPRAYFYVLSSAAFVLWAIAVIDAVQAKAGISGTDASVRQTAVLAAAAFLIPALDTIAGQLDVRLR